MRTLTLLVAAAGLAACSDGSNEGRGASARRCRTTTDSAIAVAFTRYVGSVDPKPMRFVFPVGQGDTLPSAGRQALQSIGPTYLYPTDTAKQQVVEDKLKSVGDFPTLLVHYRGLQRDSDSTAVIRLGGEYVSGSADGLRAPSRLIHLACRNGAWVFDRTADETST